jgi:hypothetical protein
MTTKVGHYEIDGLMLDMGFDMNILLNKSWEVKGKPDLVWFPVQLQLVN